MILNSHDRSNPGPPVVDASQVIVTVCVRGRASTVAGGAATLYTAVPYGAFINPLKGAVSELEGAP